MLSQRTTTAEKILVAFDGTSSAKMASDVGPVQGAPSLWFHDGVTYIVAASQLGITCVRVADGKVMWKLTAQRPFDHRDYMVINEVSGQKV